jgi:hypothetical protein
MQPMVAPAIALMFSVLIPTKAWFAPDQPLDVSIKGAGGEVTLVLTDFLGKPKETPPISAATRRSISRRSGNNSTRPARTF